MFLQKWPKYYDFLGSFEKEHFLSKSRFGWLLGNFWLNLGYFLFHHLVTLLTSSINYLFFIHLASFYEGATL